MRGIRQDKILDSTNPDNYRPIALTSHVCKTMEKMITERITYYLLQEMSCFHHFRVDLEGGVVL